MFSLPPRLVNQRVAAICYIIGISSIIIGYIASPLLPLAPLVGTISGIVALTLTYMQTHASIISTSASITQNSSSSSLNLWKHLTNVPKRKLVIFVITIVIGVSSLTYTTVFWYPQKSACMPYHSWEFWSVFSAYSSHYSPFGQNAIQASMQGQECIGISDGSFRLDSESAFTDEPQMEQAVQAYREGDIQTARTTWTSLTGGLQPSQPDAEPFIYLQNQSINNNSQNYYDIVVVTILSGNQEDQESVNIGRNELRGFYVALNDYNYYSKIPIRFLIANLGDGSYHTSQVEQQIKTLADQDKHLIGILGWPISDNDNQVIKAINDLAVTNLPIISPTATADGLSYQNNPYFFHMAPMNRVQAEADIQLVETVFNSANPNGQNIEQQKINVAVLTTKGSPYSQSLSDDFQSAAKHYPNINIVSSQLYSYTHKDADAIKADIDKIVSQDTPINIIYLPGFSEDAKLVLDELQAKDPDAHIKVVGGDGLAYVKNYPDSGYPSLQANNRLFYTSFSIPPSDCQNGNSSPFYIHYYHLFNLCPGNDAILAYDAAKTMFWAVSYMQHDTSHDINRTRIYLYTTLEGIDATHPLSNEGIVTGNGRVTFEKGERIDPITESFFVSGGKIYSMQV